MIPVRHDMKDPGKSAYVRLANYLTNPQRNPKHVFITNCTSTDIDMAAREIELEQMMHTTSTTDKTYHFTVSFPTGEEPDLETMKEFERRLCKALGFENNKRISAIHDDTDNYHMHVAICKVHNGKNRTPRADFKILAEECEKLEKEFNLQIDDRTPKGKTRSQNHIDDMERNSGQESLATYIKNNCLDIISTAKSWGELHAGLAQFDITIKKRANGFIFKAGDGTTVTASTVDRTIPKILAESLGDFSALESPSPAPSHKSYNKAPIGESEKSPLRKLYDEEITGTKKVLQTHLDAISKENLASRKALDARYKHERRLIANKYGRKVRAAHYKLAWERYRRASQKLSEKVKATRKETYEKYGRKKWVVWLQERAVRGNQDALAALRARAFGLAKKPNSVTGDKVKDGSIPLESIKNVTKKGTIIFQVNSERLWDDGSQFTMSQDASEDTAIMALKMAKKRFGPKLKLTGTNEYKQKIVAAAVAGNIKITFDDPELEAARRKLAAEKTTQNQPRQQRRR